MIKFYETPEDFKDSKLNCSAWVATAIVGSAVIGAGASIYGSGQAANAQRDAANASIAAQQQQQAQVRSDLAPFRQAGSSAIDQLAANNNYTTPIDVTKDIADPNTVAGKAYNFNLTQGLKSTQNSAAARGLGVSGAALKGASAFTTGLVDNTYTNLFNMENTNQTNAYNRLKGLVDTGENASAQTGILGQQSTNQIQAAQTGAGNATAASYNAIGGAVGNAANNIGGYAAYQGLYGGRTPNLVSGTGPSATGAGVNGI